MWGDYHARELALYIQRVADGAAVSDFFSELPMIISDINQNTRDAVSRAAPDTQHCRRTPPPIQATNFSTGLVTLEPNGGQVPWHNQEQEEVYFIVEGTAEMCLGEERRELSAGQAVYIPPGVFHQLTNVGDTPLQDDLLLRPRRRCRPLAPGTGRHACRRPASMPRRSPPAPGRSAPTNQPNSYPSPLQNHLTAIDGHQVPQNRHHHERRHRTHGHQPALLRSILAIIKQGGVKISDDEVIMPDPILVGRSDDKLESSPRGRRYPRSTRPILTRRWPTALLQSTSTPRRPTGAPTASGRRSPPASTSTARSRPPTTRATPYELYQAQEAGVKHGVVQDKLWLPGLLKLKT